MSTPVGVVGINAKFDSPVHVGLDAIASAAEKPWVDVILVVEAKHLPEHLGLDPTEWQVVRVMNQGEGKQGVAAALRVATMFVESTHWRLGLGKNRVTLDRWILTVHARRMRADGCGRVKRYRVTHLVPKRGWSYWTGQAARALAGRWHVLYADFNKRPAGIEPALHAAGRKGARLFIKSIVGFAVRRGVRAGREVSWRTPGLDHEIVGLVLWPDHKE